MPSRVSVIDRLRGHARGAAPPREALIEEHVPGRSFADIGCMWSVHGALAFAAEEAGAATVTGMDVMPPTPEYEAEHARRGSAVRFVCGDLHDEATLAQVGVHDVVWCSGVIYHAPHPLLTLERLRSITGSTLLLATEAIPELRRPRAMVFAPPPGAHPAHTEPFAPERGYVNWYWGITPSALRAMLAASGFAIVDEHRTRHHVTAIARPV